MKKVYLALAILIVVLQARLLSSEGGIGELFSLQKQLDALETSLAEQRVENVVLAEEVKSLQTNPESIETIARQTLGMVKKDEVFVNVIELQTPVVEESETGSDVTTPIQESIANSQQ